MDIEKLKNNFRKHVEKYNINDKNIKLEHSYRVMELSIKIGEYYNLSDKEIEIVTLVGLLHDYAKFEQWDKFGTYDDIDSIDHAELALERLFDDNEILDYCDNIDYYDEIYDAIKYHNKYSYPSYLSDENKLFCKIIRDADKLDIFYLLGTDDYKIGEDNKEISDDIKNKFFDNLLVDRNDVKSDSDNLVLGLAMVFDLEFDYSFKYIKDNNLIDRIYNNIDNKDKFKLYFEHINKYIEEKVNK